MLDSERDESNEEILKFLDEFVVDGPKRDIERWHPDDRAVIWSVMDDLAPHPDIPRTELLRSLIMMCGLEQSEAAAFLHLAPQSLRQKLSGKRAISDEEVAVMVHVWNSIVSGVNIDPLPEASKRIAATMAWMRQKP